MALLTDVEKAEVQLMEQGAAQLGAAAHRIVDLVNDVYWRDEDRGGINAASETGTDLLRRAKLTYAALRQVAVKAANDLPELT